MLSGSFVVAVIAVLARSAGASDLSVSLDTAESLERAKASTVGAVDFIATPAGPAAHLKMALDEPAAIDIPTAGAFNLEEGTLRFKVALADEPDDAVDQPLVTARFSAPRYQFQVRKTDRPTIAFIMTEPDRTWRRMEVPVSHWVPGTWHTVQVSWLPARGRGQALILEVDDEPAAALADAGLSLVPEGLLVGGPAFGRETTRARTGSSFSIRDLELSRRAEVPRINRAPDAEATVDAATVVGKLRRVSDFVTPWNSRKNRVPFAVDDPYGRLFRQAGFKLVRLVGFSEGWLYGVELSPGADGFSLNFEPLDANLDLYTSLGAAPYIRLAYHMPKLLSSPDRAGLAALLAAPPADWDTWRRFVRQIVTHVVREKKYPVKYWVASLNESDSPVTRGMAKWEPVCRVYEETARIIKDIDPEAKVGGPALAGDVSGPAGKLLEEFLAYCRDNQVPLDFISYHAYNRASPAEYELMQLRVRSLAEKYFPGKDLEYFLDEFNLWARDPRQNTNYAAAYLAASLHYQLRSGVTKSSIVSFNSHTPLSDLAPRELEVPGPLGIRPRMSGWPGVAERDLDVEGRRARGFVLRPPQGALTNRAYITMEIDVPQCDSARVVLFVSRPKTNRALCSVLKLWVSADGERTEAAGATLAKPGWREIAADLSRFAGERVEIEIAASPSSVSGSAAGSPVWVTRPVLIVDGESKTLAAGSKEFRSGLDSAYDWTLDSLPLVKGNVVTPAFFTYEAMNRLGDERLAVELDGRDGIWADGKAGIVATRKDGRTVILIWNFDAASALMDFVTKGRAGLLPPRNFRIIVKGLGDKETYRVRCFRIDAEHTNAFADYEQFLAEGGKPGRFSNIDTAELCELKAQQMVALDGRLYIDRSLPPASVELVVVEKTRWHFAEPAE